LGKALQERPLLRKFAIWASLISNILIVFTGAVVRLTGSGLGCPTWPKCTADSLVTVQAQGIHGVIEFTNRLLTFVLVIVAVLTVWVFRKVRWARVLTWALLAGIPAQAVVGGVSVWTKLNPWIVGCHFVLSVALIATATVLAWRFYAPKLDLASKASNVLAWLIVGFGLLAILVGVIVTGAGPHAGDAQAPRNGLNLEVWQHYHSYPAYITLGLVLSQLVLVRNNTGLLRGYSLLLAVLLVQAVIGVAQARLGVPALLVGVHVLLAATLASLLTAQRLAVKTR
jgi:cytochrome c oxidase assembly protein subunit 15